MKSFLPLIAFLGNAAVAFAQQIDEPFRVRTFVPTASGDPIGSHAYFHAIDVAVNSAGELFIADRHNAIRKIAVNGAVTTIAGGWGVWGQLVDGQGQNARFNNPWALALDAGGTIYVSDTYNSAIRKISPSGMVSTLAGSGSPGSADGIGSQARFNYPIGIAVDANGFVYSADQGNATIRKITPDGVVTTLAGLAGSHQSVDGPGSTARFLGPNRLTTDALGNIYVTDGCAVRKISPEGYVTTLAGVGGTCGLADGMGANARFNGPEGITLGPDGNLFVTDLSRVRTITPDGNVTTLAGGYPPQWFGDDQPLDGTGSEARFYLPYGIVADSRGMMYVAQSQWSGNSLIRQVTPQGVVTTLLAGSLARTNNTPPDDTAAILPLHPDDLAIDRAGNIYIAEYSYGIVRRITPSGVITTLRPTFLRGDGRREAANLYAERIVIDSQDNIFYAVGSNIGKVSPTGDVSLFAGHPLLVGSADGVGVAARFNQIYRLILDEHNNLYVADSSNCNIRKVTPDAVVTTVAGSAGNCGNTDGVGTAARFAWPTGVAVDSIGNVYVADGHHVAIGDTIRKIGLDGVVTTIAGAPGTWGYADGVGSAARFHFPTAVALDGTGNILVADSTNQRLRRVTPGGVVTTLAGGGPSSPADGIGGAAGFGILECMVSDSVGNRYIIDGDRIRIASSTLKAHPLNVSTRLQVLQNENVLIGGFIVGGTSTKQVILRALGPSLAAYQVSGALSDPLLELYDSGGHLVASNDSWKVNAQTLVSQQAAIEATTLAPANDLESALIATIQPQQGYTVVVRGSHGETGVGIVEVYDLSSWTAAALANISTRGFVESGEEVMIGGFILGETNSNAEVLVRALGPSLAQSGIANPLGNPSLELFNGNGQRIASNDDWEEPNGAAIRATGLQPTNNLESAILASLPAGAYTAVVQGHNESGVGLVEVYNLP